MSVKNVETGECGRYNKDRNFLFLGEMRKEFLYSSKEHVPPETYYYLLGKYYKECSDEYKAQLLTLNALCKVYDIYFREVIVNE